MVASCGYTNFVKIGYLLEVVKYFKGSTCVYNFVHGRCSSVFNADFRLNGVVQSSVLILLIMLLEWLLAIHSYIHTSLSANFTKWSIILKQFVDKLPTNCLSVFDHFLWVTLKGLMLISIKRLCWYFSVFVVGFYS